MPEVSVINLTMMFGLKKVNVNIKANGKLEKITGGR